MKHFLVELRLHKQDMYDVMIIIAALFNTSSLPHLQDAYASKTDNKPRKYSLQFIHHNIVITTVNKILSELEDE